jgi:glutathione S-transferase
MPEIRLHQFGPFPGVDSGSPFCTKVHRALAFKGLAYRPKNAASPAAVKKINPRGKLPVIELDGRLIPDSSAIFRALDELQPEPRLYPEDVATRARVKLLEDWADESLYWFAVHQRWGVDENFKLLAKEFTFIPAALRWLVPPMIRRGVLKSLFAQGIGRLAQSEVLEQLETHLDMLVGLLGDGPFFVGEAPTAADFAIFGPLQAMRQDMTPEARQRVEARSTLVAWMRRVDGVAHSEHTAKVV